jgi:hypothetical protein
MENTGNVSILQIRRLLQELKNLRSNVLCRPRLIAELWQPAFLQITKLTELGVVFRNPSTGQLMEVRDLNNIMQFELDSPFQHYLPHFHYTLNPLFNQDGHYANTIH